MRERIDVHRNAAGVPVAKRELDETGVRATKNAAKILSWTCWCTSIVHHRWVDACISRLTWIVRRGILC